jgi:tripartite-type tricarboxylate transporter receptor subunit TctC
LPINKLEVEAEDEREEKMSIKSLLGTVRLSRIAAIGLVFAVLALASGVTQTAHAASDYPNRPVHIILAYGPGGVSDIIARILASHLEKTFGQRFLVENNPGAAGAVATQKALSGDRQGYTILNSGNAATIRKTTMPNLPFDVERDFDSVSPIATFDMVMVTKPASTLKTVKDVIAFAKANPGKLNIGTVSVGSTQNLSAVLFRKEADIKATIIPFKKSPELMGATSRGEVDIAMETIAGAQNAIKAGQVVPIATTGAHRSEALPKVPTVEESGIKPFVVGSWNSYVVPKGVPVDVIKKLNTEIQRILHLPDVKKKMVDYGMEPFYGGPEAVDARYKEDVAKWHNVILEAGIPIKK